MRVSCASACANLNDENSDVANVGVRAHRHHAKQHRRVEQLLQLFEVVLEQREHIHAVGFPVPLRADRNVALELAPLVRLRTCVCGSVNRMSE